MVDTKKHPTYLLNKYVWALLKNNTSMTESDYGDRTPIVPSNMEPEFTEFNKPFLVYGYSEDTTPDLYAMRSGSLSYAVWSTSVGEVNNILNVIRAGMERRDESAREVTKWTEANGGNTAGSGIRFDDIYIGYLEGPTPEETEGGRQAGIITLRYQYTADYIVSLPL